jgi:ATP-binding cassette, subfamily B, bacterial
VTALGFVLGFLRPYRARVVGAALALVISTSALLLFGQGLRLLVDHGFERDAATLARALMALVGIALVMAMATSLRYYLFTWLGERVGSDLRKTLFNHLLTLGPAYYETARLGDILSGLTADATLVQTAIGSSASLALRNLVSLLGGSVMLALTSVKLFISVLLGLPLLVWPVLHFGRRVRQLARDSQDRLGDVGAYADETLHAIRTVQAFVHEDTDRSQFAVHADAAFAVAAQRARQRGWLTALAISLVFAAICLVLWLGGQDVLAGKTTSGQLSAFLFYALMVALAFAALSEVWGELQRVAGAVERVQDLLNVQPVLVVAKNPRPLTQPVRGSVGFEQVSFRYPARPEINALSEFNLAVREGETLALVGPSGAGKSTVFQLLLRFYDPQIGRVCFDGIDLRELSPQDLRACIGIVPQDPVIFGASAWDNIRYGRPNASAADVQRAARAAHVSEFIEALPEGYATFLGERGVRLSGGQRQRIAIARAILRAPALLLLDEATSALDAESERLVQDSLQDLAAGRTTLVIAHRLTTVQNADRIAVIEDGRVVAVGQHEQLRQQSTLYARLAALQFRDSETTRQLDIECVTPD